MLTTPLWRRYARFFGSDIQADVEDELRFHLDSKVEELVAQGWPLDRALAEAQRQFGNVAQVHEVCRKAASERETKMRSANYFASWRQDIGYAFRQMKHRWGNTLLAILTLGLGIGAVVSVFSIVDAVLLRPLPFPAPHRLVTVWSTREGANDVVTPRNFDSVHRESKSFSDMAAVQRSTFTLSRSGGATQVPGAFASADLFRVFGVAPELGRTFTHEEDQRPRARVAILSHRLWREEFGGDRQIVGAQIRLNREPYTVIGVMPSTLSLRADSEQVWIPLALSGQEMNWTGGVLNVYGRLRYDVTLTQAQAEMAVLARNLEVRYPEMNRGRGIRLQSFAADLVGDYRHKLLLLLGAVGFVLLIACSNVANLLLAQGAGRTQELAVRAALGANRSRIMGQLVTESFLMALAGAVIGIILSDVAISVARSTSLAAIPRLGDARLNGAALSCALLMAIFTTMFAGILPAVRAVQLDLQTVLRQGGRTSAGFSRDRARSAYIAAEVALALVLLVGAGLLIRTAIVAEHRLPGFSTNRLLTARTSLPVATYKGDQVIRTYERIVEKLAVEPSVTAVALTSKIPLTLSSVGLNLKPGSVITALQTNFATDLRLISADYARTLQIPILAGREFTARDRINAPQVALVNETLARKLWPNGNPVGETIRLPELEGRDAVWQIVGEMKDQRENGLMADAPAVLYIPYTQVTANPWHWVEQSLYLVARTQSDPVGGFDPIRNAIRSVDPELPLGDELTMDQRMAQAASAVRFYTGVLTILGAAGLLLTAVGIYGMVAYFVSRQRAEIGIRLALGSSIGGVIALIIRQGMRPVGIGLGVGLLLSLATTRLLSSQLYGIGPTDPITLTCVAGILSAVAALACYLPARQAARIDPMEALRTE